MTAERFPAGGSYLPLSRTFLWFRPSFGLTLLMKGTLMVKWSPVVWVTALFFLFFFYFFWDYFLSSCWHPAFTATLPAFRPLELSCCIWTGDAFAFPPVLTVVTVGPVTFAERNTRATQLFTPPPQSPWSKRSGSGCCNDLRKAPPGGQSCCHKSYPLLESYSIWVRQHRRFWSLDPIQWAVFWPVWDWRPVQGVYSRVPPCGCWERTWQHQAITKQHIENSLWKLNNCVNGRWWIVPNLSGRKKKKALSFFCFAALSPLKSHKSSLVLFVFAKIFRPSNTFTGKLIHAASEYGLSCLKILIRQLKSFKPLHEGKVLNADMLLLLRGLIRRRTASCGWFCSPGLG